MTANKLEGKAREIHSCSYYCDRPDCVKAQRDDLREKYVARQSEGMVLVPREPTREMIAAGTLGGILTPNQACASYQAQVIAAAPADAGEG